MSEEPVTFPIEKKPAAKKKPARRKKGPKTKLMEECDRLFGQIIRSSGPCVTCGGVDVIQCSHGFSRRYKSVRWDERNAWPQCRACHMRYTHNPLLWDAWLRERWGAALYEEIRLLALNGRNPDMTETVERLRHRLDEVEGRAA